jgi:uncharacterized membrane protein
MYFWNYKKLAVALRNGEITGKRYTGYIVVAMIVFLLGVVGDLSVSPDVKVTAITELVFLVVLYDAMLFLESDRR